MKKIKIMLSAVVIFTIVGGALAFKANTLTSKKIYCENSLHKCVVPITSITSVNPGSLEERTNPCPSEAGSSSNFGLNPVTNGPCPLAETTFYTIPD